LYPRAEDVSIEGELGESAAGILLTAPALPKPSDCVNSAAWLK
jgi:hypothetical protein